MTSHTDTVREQVARDYARAVESPAGDDAMCCASSCCGGGLSAATTASVQKGIAVKSAGYSPDELAALPSDAIANSFGCGNPLAFADVREGDVVLDLGSGAGIDILIAARKVGPAGRAIGIDMTDAMLERARANIAASGLDNVEVRKGIIEEMPVETASVDWVISNCVINLSPEKNRVFAEIARVLKPGGRARISDIVVDELPAWAREDESLYSSCIAGAISEAAYLQGLRDAGLVDVEVAERYVYDEAQLESFIRSELPADGGADFERDAARFAHEMLGKVWSAKFTARKTR
jgi:arsenite methyltransferase